MAGRREIRCIGPSYTLQDRKSAVQRAVNLYIRQIEGLGEDKQIVLDSAPGLKQIADAGASVRGYYATESRRFVAAGYKLYEQNADDTLTERGSLLTGSGFVGMKHGRDQLVIVDGLYGYVFRLQTNVFTQITSAGWRGSDWVEELDGYFIFVDPDTDQFYLSAIDDASTLDALDFSSADAQPDDIVTHRTLKRELYLFGTRSTEVWIDTGGVDFPLTRYNSTPIDIGIVGKRAITRTTDTMVWVGQTERGRGYVYQMTGHQPVRISTQAVEEALDQSTDLASCVLWSYHIRGNEFVGINAPGLTTTWVYDLASQQWHERGEWVDGAWVQSRVENVCFLDGKHYASGGTKLYLMSHDLQTVDGSPVVRERTWPHLISPTLEPVPYRGMELLCTTGQGMPASGSNYAPWSEDLSHWEIITGSGVVVTAAAGAAPSVTTGTAYRFSTAASSGFPTIYPFYNTPIAVPVGDLVVSIYGKLDSGAQHLHLFVGDWAPGPTLNPYRFVEFDLVGGAIAATDESAAPVGFTPHDAITLIGSGYYRLTASMRSSTGLLAVGIGLGSFATGVTAPGGFLLDGLQVNAGTSADGYIKTTGTAVAGSGSTATEAAITLEISNDGGYTFGPPLPRSLGAVGAWMQRVRWLRLGASRNRVFRLRCTDPVPLTIHDAAVDA